MGKRSRRDAPAGGAEDGANVNAGNGPSANNRKLGLYKTELCRSWEEKGSCRYGAKCQFAHGEEELRKVQRHPKVRTIVHVSSASFVLVSDVLPCVSPMPQYKTEICRVRLPPLF